MSTRSPPPASFWSATTAASSPARRSTSTAARGTTDPRLLLVGRGSSRLSRSLGIGIAGRVVSTIPPKDVLFLGNNALDGFHERQVSLSLGQSSVGAGAVGEESTLALHPL